MVPGGSASLLSGAAQSQTPPICRACVTRASLSDADVDGSHIKVLLLTLFFKHFPMLIEHGHACVASPPLYCVDVPSLGNVRRASSTPWTTPSKADNVIVGID